MKTRIECRAFNGSTIECDLEIHIDDLRFQPPFEEPDLLPAELRAQVRDKVLEGLKKAFPDHPVASFSYRLISRDLETMDELMVTPDHASLATIVGKLILGEVARRVGAELDTGYQQLRERQHIFAQQFLGASASAISEKVRRADALYQEREFEGLQALLEHIDADNLSEAEIETIAPITFALDLRYSRCQVELMEARLEAYLSRFEAVPRLRKRGYFIAVEAFEDCRDASRVQRVMEKLESEYPRSFFNRNELAKYWSAKARMAYGRGEYLQALQMLQISLAHTAPDDDTQRAEAQVTAANCLADNLFFAAARDLAATSLASRRRAHSPRQFESLGCMAGIAFKARDFSDAWAWIDLYQQALKNVVLTDDERNRMYNYAAKVAIMMGNYATARKYLDIAAATGDRLGFSAATEMLLGLKTNDAEKVKTWYRDRFSSPVETRGMDKFAVGWANVFMARALFEEGAWLQGAKYLAQAAKTFKADNYILEAAYITRYLSSYPLTGNAHLLFDKIQSRDDLLKDFSDHVAAHERMQIDHAKALGAQAEAEYPAMLHQLLKALRSLSDPEAEVENLHILDCICLY